MTDRFLTAIAAVALFGILATAVSSRHIKPQSASEPIKIHALKPPANGTINVAFLISEGAVVIDFAGPWEVFADAMYTSKGEPYRGGEDMVMPFHTYTVSDSTKPISANGLIIVPNYSFENAPKPQVIVVPAQSRRSAAQKKWLLENSKTADVTMSVCTGASLLAAYGLLDHQKATTFHLGLQEMQKQYPAVQFVSGTRFVDNDKIATAGGLSSGIDLALHIVERYYGRDIAQATAEYLEYTGELWKNPQFAEIKAVTAAK